MPVRHRVVLAGALLGVCAAAPLAAAHAAPTLYSSAQVEAIVRAYFADIPAMAEVARCESGYRQFAADGTVLADPSNSWIGAFQISRIHSAEAAALGDDLESLEGNMMYARFLYNQSGLAPWYSSQSCWGSATTEAPVVPTATSTAEPTATHTPSAPQAASTSASSMSPSSAEATQTVQPTTQPGPSTRAVSIEIPLWLGAEEPSVMVLQQTLNRAGFALATEGPGSPGQETEKFGALTRSAVRTFQCAKLALCAGDENTTGYGVVGPRTLAALEALGPIAVAH